MLQIFPLPPLGLPTFGQHTKNFPETRLGEEAYVILKFVILQNTLVEKEKNI